MSLKKDRQRVQLAAKHLIAQRRQLHRQTQWLAEGLERFRPALLVGGGLIAGLLIGRGKLSDATRSVSAFAGLGMSLMRSSIGTIVLSRAFRASADPDAQAQNGENSQGVSKPSPKI